MVSVVLVCTTQDFWNKSENEERPYGLTRMVYHLGSIYKSGPLLRLINEFGCGNYPNWQISLRGFALRLNVLKKLIRRAASSAIQRENSYWSTKFIRSPNPLLWTKIAAIWPSEWLMRRGRKKLYQSKATLRGVSIFQYHRLATNPAAHWHTAPYIILSGDA